MKTSALLLAALFLTACKTPQEKADQAWYGNGVVTLKGSDFSFVDAKGVLRVEGMLKDGKKEGTWIFFDFQGVKDAEVGYKDDALSGPCLMWYGSFQSPDIAGKKKLEAVFDNGAFHGPYANYYPNGQKRSDVLFDHGKIIKARAWEKDGKEVSEKMAMENALNDFNADIEYLADRENVIALSLKYAQRVSS